MKGALTSTSVKKDGASRWHNTLVYMRQHWQLYLFFMLPAVLLTVIFRYIPMGGVLIAFTEYSGSASATSDASCHPRTLCGI